MRTHRSFLWTFLLGLASVAAAQAPQSPSPLNRPQRNNNPLNIKHGTATSHWVANGLATLDPAPATDGGRFLKFREVDAGFAAARDLLRSGVYRDLDLNRALRKWSGNGYGDEIVPSALRGRTVGQLSDRELDQMISGMAQREGFYANGYRPALPSDSPFRELAEAAGKVADEIERDLARDVAEQVARVFRGSGRTVRPTEFGALSDGTLRGARAGEAAGRVRSSGDSGPAAGLPRFALPAGWTVEREADPIHPGVERVTLRNDTPQAKGTISIFRHGGTADQIGRLGLRKISVGKKRLPAYHTQAFGGEAVWILADGVVYHVGLTCWLRPPNAAQQAFWEVVNSLEFASRPDTTALVADAARGQARDLVGPAAEAAAGALGPPSRFTPPDPLPEPGRYADYLGLRWDGRSDDEQCVWAARQFAERYVGRTLPRLGARGGAERLFRIATPGFRRVANDGSTLPPPGALVIWDASVGDGAGHVAVTLGVANANTRVVRVIDSNYGEDRRGQIHDVQISARIQGWLVAE